MRKLLLAALIAFAATPAVAQLQPDKVYDLKLTGTDISQIADLLGQGPYAKVAPILQKLLDQTKEPAKPAPPPPKK